MFLTGKMSIGALWSLMLALSLIVLSWGVSDDRAYGLGQASDYSFQDEYPYNDTDPVTVMFQGSHANALGAAEALEAHAGWTVSGGGLQRLWVLYPGYWSMKTNEYQRANGTLSRFHIRLWFIPISRNLPKLKTAGTPHHEDFVINTIPPCGHAVDSNGPTGSGFDWGRREVSEKMFAGGHTAQQNEYWGNTQNFKQCDGDWAGSNGTGVRIPLNHGH